MVPQAPARPIILLVCDDHKILTDALAMVIDSDPALEMPTRPVHTPDEAVSLSREHHPDVVLMDVKFRGAMNGIEATRRIKTASPETKVIIMTAHEDESLMIEAVEAGASGFLTKSEAAGDVLSAVKAAADGDTLIDPATLTRLLHQVAGQRQDRRDAVQRLSTLTDRELEILQRLGAGARNDAIAERLKISPQTVQTHIRNILSKLDVHSKLEAVAFAVKNGAISV
ncbi:MAG: response regulator transcription factor [Actinomycetota bacterium]